MKTREQEMTMKLKKVQVLQRTILTVNQLMKSLILKKLQQTENQSVLNHPQNHTRQMMLQSLVTCGLQGQKLLT